jgi:hypothetical protein
MVAMSHDAVTTIDRVERQQLTESSAETASALDKVKCRADGRVFGRAKGGVDGVCDCRVGGNG